MGFDSAKLSVLYFSIKIDISTRLYHVTQGLKVKRQHVVLRAFSHFYAVHDKQQVPTNFNAKRLMLDESIATQVCLSLDTSLYIYVSILFRPSDRRTFGKDPKVQCAFENLVFSVSCNSHRLRQLAAFFIDL
jgi:hypothetical protein